MNPFLLKTLLSAATEETKTRAPPPPHFCDGEVTLEHDFQSLWKYAEEGTSGIDIHCAYTFRFWAPYQGLANLEASTLPLSFTPAWLGGHSMFYLLKGLSCFLLFHGYGRK